jgi:hypothetical protein
MVAKVTFFGIVREPGFTASSTFGLLASHWSA